MNDDTTELPACPFCGGECDPKEVGYTKGDDPEVHHSPGCTKCGATVGTIEQWCARTPDTALHDKTSDELGRVLSDLQATEKDKEELIEALELMTHMSNGLLHPNATDRSDIKKARALLARLSSQEQEKEYD